MHKLKIIEETNFQILPEEIIAFIIAESFFFSVRCVLPFQPTVMKTSYEATSSK